MEVSKLHNIIKEQNEHRERKALNEAESIIEAIAHKQVVIATIQKEITELRNQLTKLEITQLDVNTILGGE